MRGKADGESTRLGILAEGVVELRVDGISLVDNSLRVVGETSFVGLANLIGARLLAEIGNDRT
jgi:hypothetical protein